MVIWKGNTTSTAVCTTSKSGLLQVCIDKCTLFLTSNTIFNVVGGTIS